MYSKKRITIDIEYATEYQEYMSDDMIKITLQVFKNSIETKHKQNKFTIKEKPLSIKKTD